MGISGRKKLLLSLKIQMVLNDMGRDFLTKTIMLFNNPMCSGGNVMQWAGSWEPVLALLPAYVP